MYSWTSLHKRRGGQTGAPACPVAQSPKPEPVKP